MIARLFRVSSLLVLLLHALAAATWAWIMPRGFPLLHLRTLSNLAAPLLVLGLVVAALWAARRERDRLHATILLALSFLWLGAAVSFAFAYPHGHPLSQMAPFTIAVVVGLAVPRQAIRWTSGTIVSLLAAAALGVALPLTQKSPPATTVPAGIELPADLPPATDASARTARLSKQVHVGLADARVSLQRDRLTVDIFPLLNFISRSRDGGWIAWARPVDRLGPRKQLTGCESDRNHAAAQYEDDGRHHLSAHRTDGDDGSVIVESFSHYGHTVYSHLNTFTEIWMVGHRKPSIRFSPCPESTFEVRDMGDPVVLDTANAMGAPARFAYLDAAGTFRVVEASNGEKGPYKTLAEGMLARSEALTITMLDHDSPVLQVTLEDWAAQASTDLSPTAGWGVPMNAIEFSRQNESESSAVSLFITLASTSVGRGFDSVAHAPGTYRNRIRARLIDPPTTRPAP